MFEDVEITVDEKLYRDFSQLCAELGVTPECCPTQMLSWMAENPTAAMAYIRKAAAEQSKPLKN